MKGFVSTVLLGALVVGLAGSAAAFDNKQAGIALHIARANSVAPPCDPGVTAPTVVSETTGDSNNNEFFWTYLLVCNGSDSTGIAGMEMGIQYPASIQIYDWRVCSDLQFPDNVWPASGGSNLLTWAFATNCQNDRSEPAVPRTVVAIGGYFYMGAYGPSQMFVTPRPVSGRAKVADCSSREDDLTFAVPSHLGVAAFATASASAVPVSGYNPCGAPTAVQPSTWSGIKNLIEK